MAKDYSEDQLIQRSTAEFLENELGWKSVYAFDQETLGVNGTLGRTNYHEVLLTRHLGQALKRLNPWLTDKQLQECMERMTEHMSSQTLMQINEQKYQLIRDGIPVTRVKPNGETEEVRAKVIDFASPDKNEFLCVRELQVHGALYRRRADIVGSSMLPASCSVNRFHSWKNSHFESMVPTLASSPLLNMMKALW